VVLLVVSTCFAIIRLAPGDPFAQQVEQEGVAADVRVRLRSAFGYDRPLPEQYLRFVVAALRGELGWSHARGRPVREVLARAIPATVTLMGAALFVGLTLGVLLGAWQGWRPDSALARVSDRLGLLVVSVPEFVLALLLMLGPALAWGLFPVNGMQSLVPPADTFAALFDRLRHLALPAGTLAMVVAAIVARHQRAAMHDVRDAPFVRSARARGLSESRLLWRHAWPNALVPVLTLLGLLLPTLVGGAVLVERIFGWPGMGSVLVDAVVARDYHLVVGSVLVSSVAVVLGTLVADFAVLWLDPRRRAP
jgi:peptide/nickel transport system permease protein